MFRWPDDSSAGNRKYFVLSSAAQSRRHRGRPDRGGVLVCVVLPLSSVPFPGSVPQRLHLRRDSERLRVCPQSEAVLRGPQALRRGLSGLAVWHKLTRALPDLAK